MKCRLSGFALAGLLILAGCGGSGGSSSFLGGGGSSANTGPTTTTTTTTTSSGATTTSTTSSTTSTGTTTTSTSTSTTTITSSTTTTTTSSTTSAALTPTGSSSPGGIREYTLPGVANGLTGICKGSDNRLWFTENLSGAVDRLDVNGNWVQYNIGAGRPSGICAGPDSNLWVVAGNAIYRVTTAGVATAFARNSGPNPPGTSAPLEAICVGPSGTDLWFADSNNGRIGRITTSGVMGFFDVPGGAVPFTGPHGICAGPDGNLWFTCRNQRLGRMTPSGTFTMFTAGISSGVILGNICSGPDGNLWFTGAAQRIYRATTSGGIAEFASGFNSATIPVGICAGPNASQFLYFSEFAGPGVGRISTGGAVTEFSGVTGNGSLDICVGPDNHLWFTESGFHKIGVLTPP